MTAPWIVAFVALWVLVIALGLLVLGTMRRLVPLLERSQEVISSSARRLAIGGLPPGTSVPPFTAQGITGATFVDTDLRGSTAIVLFLGSGCMACERLVDDLEHGRVPDLGARLVVVSDDRAEALRLGESAEVTVLVDENRTLARLFESAAAPHAFILDEHGTVLANGTPDEWEGLRHLFVTAKGGDRESDRAAAAMSS